MTGLKNWAVVAHNDDTGFGRMAEDLKAVLGVGWHFVIPSERLTNRPLKDKLERMLPTNASEDFVRHLLSKVDGVIFFERPNWHPSLLRLCRELGVKSICCPMWEWFQGNDPTWRLCDLFACTSNMARRTVESYGYRNHVDIGIWPFNRVAFPQRFIEGPARRFVHNAGIVDTQDRKGTAETILAFHRVKRKDIRLDVRLQKSAKLPSVIDSRINIVVGNTDDPADLYMQGDVAIQPSKMEGIGFMVLEPVMCGIPVITLDYEPMSEYVMDPRMLVKKRPFKRKAFPSAWVKHAHLRLPCLRDLSRRISWCAENDLSEISIENLRYAEKNQNRSDLLERWNSAIASIDQR